MKISGENSFPMVSVIIPCYNTIEYLPGCLDSVLTQDMPEFELIAVNDGSPDDSLTLLNEYAEKDSRIQVHNQPNLFTGLARNNGMGHATGKYIFFLDSDDRLLPGALRTLVTRAEKTDADIVLSRIVDLDEKTGRIRHNAFSGIRINRLDTNIIFSAADRPEDLFQLCGPVVCGKLFRRSFIERHNLRFNALPRSEDIPFAQAAMAVADRIAATGAETYSYLQRPGSIEHTKDRYPLMFLESFRELYTFLEKNGKLPLLRNTFIHQLYNTLFYNLETYHSLDSVIGLCNAVRREVVPFYCIDVNAPFEGANLNSESCSFIRAMTEAPSADAFLTDELKQARLGRKAEKKLETVRQSKSYRIGCAVTRLPHRLKGLFVKKK